MRENIKDIIGVGIGPFNLSLASLLAPVDGVESLFFDGKREFSWHNELLFGDSNMQTSYLKDLVTPVDPTNKNSFLNYLSHKGLLYQFLNAGRKTIRREEFQDYCKWSAQNLNDKLLFDHIVENVSVAEGGFEVHTSKGKFYSKNLCIGTGHQPNIPAAGADFLGENVFHIKSPGLAGADFTGKKVAVVGGGQSGVEVFRNAIKNKWGSPASVSLVSSRSGLRPLEEGPFVDEFFTPGFVNEFVMADQASKDALLAKQKYASDGNTPGYLQELYEELYFAKHYGAKLSHNQILPMRRFNSIEKVGGGYRLGLRNSLANTTEYLGADVVVFATGFKSVLPKAVEGISRHIQQDQIGRPLMNSDYSMKTDLPEKSKIFGMNLSRHHHGIADPQISMMAWRSAVVVNSIVKREIYNIGNYASNFCQYGPIEENDWV